MGAGPPLPRVKATSLETRTAGVLKSRPVPADDDAAGRLRRLYPSLDRKRLLLGKAEVIAHVEEMDAARVKQIVERARAAQPGWAALGFEQRGELLKDLRRWLVQNRRRVVDTLVADGIVDPLFPRSLRRKAIARAVAFVTERLNGEDGLGAIYAAMANTVMMFDLLGYRADHPDLVVARRSVAAQMSVSASSIARLVRAYGDCGSSGDSSVTSKVSLGAYSDAVDENTTRGLPSVASSSNSSSDFVTLSR